MQESGIYKITNTKTGRAYIGSSVNITSRLAHHFNELSKGIHHCSYLQNSYNKWGKDAFDADVIEYVDDIKILLEREQFYIDSIGLDSLYNTHPMARSPLGVKRTAETKAKLSASKMGYKHSEETLLKRRLRKHPEEVLAKLRGRKPTEETRAKLSAAHLGSKRSEETKKKMSIAGKARTTSEETREKLRAAWVQRAARGVAEETREKQKASAIKPDSQCKAVQQLNPHTGEVIATFYSAGEAHRQTHTCQSSISNVCMGKARVAGGFGWRYL